MNVTHVENNPDSRLHVGIIKGYLMYYITWDIGGYFYYILKVICKI